MAIKQRFYDIGLYKDAFTLFRVDHVTLQDGSPYIREQRLARFTYLPQISEWRLDWPNLLFTWRPGWHTPKLKEFEKLVRDVADAESQEELKISL